MKRHCDADVVIVGGGIIGATFACLLRQVGLNVILLEIDTCQVHSQKEKDPRVFAITIASEKILTKAGVWQRLKDEDIAYFRKMHVWDENGSGKIIFDSAEICKPTMGYIVSYQAIADALREMILDTENIRCLWSGSPTFIRKENKTIIIETEDGSDYHAKLLIAADGGNSKIAKLAGVTYTRRDYKQSALACIVTTERPHNEIARQRFLQGGPLAFLPMKNPYQCAVVLSTTPDYAQHLIKLDETAFHFELAEAFGNELGKIKSSMKRVMFPLSRAQADQYTRSRIALIGDSAHIIHPLAGLGANLGLLDAAALAEIVIEIHQRGRDIGRLQGLHRYERWRKGENKNIMYLMDGFKFLFESQCQPIQWMRNLGLDIVDSVPIVKHAIMKRAMGLNGDLPSICHNQLQ